MNTAEEKLIEVPYKADVVYYRTAEGANKFDSTEPFITYGVDRDTLRIETHNSLHWIMGCLTVTVPGTRELADVMESAFQAHIGG